MRSLYAARQVSRRVLCLRPSHVASLLLLLGLLTVGGQAAADGPVFGGGEEPPPTAPQIVNFEIIEDRGIHAFTGDVIWNGGSVEGLTITFGGVTQGRSAVTDAYGYFYLTCDLNGQWGEGTAQTTAGGMNSNLIEFMIWPR